MDKDYLTTSEAARYLGVCVDTMYRWEKRGIITSFRLPGGFRRYAVADLEAVKQGKPKEAK